MIYVFGVANLFDCRIQEEVVYFVICQVLESFSSTSRSIVKIYQCCKISRQQQYRLLKLSSVTKFLINLGIFKRCVFNFYQDPLELLMKYWMIKHDAT
jgi:hypothetical protein